MAQEVRGILVEKALSTPAGRAVPGAFDAVEEEEELSQIDEEQARV